MAHKLRTTWQLWAHLPHDTNWGLDSYVNVMTAKHAEDLTSLKHTVPEKLVSSCMLFFMREAIDPIWEHPSNRDGGCFSYKISNKIVADTWWELCMLVAGESISTDSALTKAITGVSVSPKKGFCVVKIWMANLNHQNASKIECSMKAPGCLFKRHSE